MPAIGFNINAIDAKVDDNVNILSLAADYTSIEDSKKIVF